MAGQKQEAPSIDLQRKLNELLTRSSWQRTSDIGADLIVPGQIEPKATSLKTDWFGPFRVDRPSTFQLLRDGVDVSHVIALIHYSPDDLTWSSGRAKRNALGKGFPLAVGDYWVYVPQLAGDPAYFTARLSDASSDLASAPAALEDGGAAQGVVVVTTLNRPSIASGRIEVPTPGTAVQGPDQAIPNGCAVVIKADADNAGKVYVGESDVAAEDHDVAYPLDEAGEVVKFYVDNLNKLYFDADNADEGVRWVVEQ